jgi:multiple sugar transport system substrate-binding protein
MNTPSPRKAYRILVSTAVLGGLLTAAGCAGTDPAPPEGRAAQTTPSKAAPVKADDPNAPVELSWWTGQTADAQTLLEGFAKEFTGLHPNVKIKASSGAPTTDALLQKISAGFAAGSYPDISYAFGSWASELGASGKTLDISGNVGDPAMKWDEFPAAARETATPDGKTIGVPAIVDNLALFYNKTVFDQAGVDYPTDQMTWDQFRETAKKLTNPAKNIFGTAFDVTSGEGTTWALWPQLWQNGGTILSDDDTKAAFNSPAGVKTLQFWHDMSQVDKSVYLDQTAAKTGPLFASNYIGMMISGPWQLYTLGQAKTKYGVTILPGTNGDHQTVSGPDIWALFDHQDANRAYWAFKFVEWLTEPAQDVRWSIHYGNLPLRSSEMSTPEFAARAKESPGYELLAENLKNAKQKRPTVQGYVGLSKAFGEAVSKVIQGQGDVKESLDEAAKKADRALADG